MFTYRGKKVKLYTAAGKFLWSYGSGIDQFDSITTKHFDSIAEAIEYFRRWAEFPRLNLYEPFNPTKDLFRQGAKPQ